MSSLAAVSAAMKLGGQVTGFVAGGNTKAVAEDAAKVEGLTKSSMSTMPIMTRVYLKTSPPYSSKTSKREASPTS